MSRLTVTILGILAASFLLGVFVVDTVAEGVATVAVLAIVAGACVAAVDDVV